MKEKIIIFIVGLLLGSIISTGAIYFYTIALNNNQNQQIGNEGFGRGEFNKRPDDMIKEPIGIPENNMNNQEN